MWEGIVGKHASHANLLATLRSTYQSKEHAKEHATCTYCCASFFIAVRIGSSMPMTLAALIAPRRSMREARFASDFTAPLLDSAAKLFLLVILKVSTWEVRGKSRASNA